MNNICSRLVVFTFALGFLTCSYVPKTHAQNPRFVAFKQKMMPKVGKRTSITGTLQSGKLGWFVVADGWGVYIYATSDLSLKNERDLEPFLGRRVRATGTLLYRSASYSERADVTGVPEHFCFDGSEVKIVALPQQQKSLRRNGLKGRRTTGLTRAAGA